MAQSTGPVLLIGAITMGRQVLIDQESPDFRVAVATGIAAGMFALAEKAIGPVAPAIAWVGVISVIFVRINPGRPAPAEAMLKLWNQL
jgi:hypothetical protein